MDKIEEILSRGVANIIPSREKLKLVLLSNRKLNVYLGIDPTAPQIHLGHGVPLRKLQAFVELGHKVTFLIGDFTALIGDTSDKDSERPVLTAEKIEKNFQTYKEQAGKILDFSKVKVRYNSEWLKKLEFKETVKLCQHFSGGEFVSRELIKKRLNEGKKLGLHEFLYPVMQGYDSYFLDTDIQIGGTDQTFNMQAGRTLQRDLRGKESFVMAMAFLMGTDGRKMSKTWNNAIWLEDEPSDMYRKVLAINDNLIRNYFILATNMPISKIDEISSRLESGENPLAIKKILADKIVTELHGKEAANKAGEAFKSFVQDKEIPVEEIRQTKSLLTGATITDVLFTAKVAESKSHAKRIIEQGGVTADNIQIKDPNTPFASIKDKIIQFGRWKKFKIKTVP